MPVIKFCPICDLEVKSYTINNKIKIICANSKDHTFYIEFNDDYSIADIYAIIDKFGISWHVSDLKSLSVCIAFSEKFTKSNFYKINLNYFEPNLLKLKDQFIYILNKCKVIRVFI